MKTEYQKSLQAWVSGLTDSKLAEYMESLDLFNDDELDALTVEDVRRMQTAK
jgi:hypothetical protein